MLNSFTIKYIFHLDKEMPVALGSKNQKGSMIAFLDTKLLWQKESLKQKFKSFLKLGWEPSEELLAKEAKETFMYEVFGLPSDWGEELFALMEWHHSQDWNLNELTEFDQIRAGALDAMSIMVRMKHRKLSSNVLHLQMAERAQQMCLLTIGMVVKVPVVSLQYFLDIHSAFAFNSIRRSKHPQADEIISYLYETIFIQQKISLALHEFIALMSHTENQKNQSMFIRAEINAIMSADAAFSYLKASVEKIIVLIGLTYNIKNLDAKKSHKSKIDTLLRDVPERAKKQYYCQFIFEFIRSENLDELNNYRSGLLHKKGISDLQPHNYIGEKGKSLPLRKIFQVLIEQHAKNTAVLLGTLALLTDELVRLDHPKVNFEELFNIIFPFEENQPNNTFKNKSNDKSCD